MKVELKQSPVVFSENPHGYRLGELRLSGITSLIHDVLHLGVYPEANDFVREVAIPRAGEYGKSVHKAIEDYDTLGVKVTAYPKSERFRTKDDDGFWHVEDELESYIRHLQGYEPIANEYTVSDEIRYASNIDNVWLKSDTQGIWLVDTKTNNLEHYPDGEQGLKEYLSWQLSIYAYLFERQNAELKVEGLACNWLRHGDSAFWTIERKPDELVQKLLSVEWILGDFGFIYDGYDIAAEILAESVSNLPATTVSSAPILPQDVVKGIYDVEIRLKEMKALHDTMKSELRQAMESNGIKSWDSGLFKATIAADSEVKTFDTTRFKKDHPELYKEYQKTTVKKGGFTIKLKELQSN